MILYGLYRWFPKTVAYRADFCLACDAERLALRIRTVDFLWIFWIPVLPVGLWRRWYCSQCGNPPHRVVKTRRGFKLAAALLFLFFAAIFWISPAAELEPEISAAEVWGLRVGTLVLSIPLFWWALRSGTEPTLEQRLVTVQPLEVTECPICGHGLQLLRGQALCRSCGAEHLPLEQPGRLSSGPSLRGGDRRS